MLLRHVDHDPLSTFSPLVYVAQRVSLGGHDAVMTEPELTPKMGRIRARKPRKVRP